MTLRILILTGLVGFACAACSTAVVGGMSEREAIDTGVLLERFGIPTTVERTGSDRWEVRVPEDMAPLAREVVSAHRLVEEDWPAEPEHFTTISGAVHHDRIERDLERRLTTSIERLDGVYDARVHVVLPRHDWGQSATSPQTSVLVLRSEDSDQSELSSEVTTLVTGAVEGLTPELVSVVFQTPDVSDELPLSWEQVGPWRVAPGQARTLRWALGTGLLLLVGLSIGLGWQLLARRRRRQ